MLPPKNSLKFQNPLLTALLTFNYFSILSLVIQLSHDICVSQVILSPNLCIFLTFKDHTYPQSPQLYSQSSSRSTSHTLTVISDCLLIYIFLWLSWFYLKSSVSLTIPVLFFEYRCINMDDQTLTVVYQCMKKWF